MPALNNSVNFKFGLYSSWKASVSSGTVDINTIYFCTDRGIVCQGDTEYSHPVSIVSNIPKDETTGAETTTGYINGDLIYVEASETFMMCYNNTWIAIGGPSIVLRILELETQISGLSGAMHFRGVVVEDPTTEDVATSGVLQTAAGTIDNFEAGDVVLYNDAEYVYANSIWTKFGDTSEYATKAELQTALAWGTF